VFLKTRLLLLFSIFAVDLLSLPTYAASQQTASNNDTIVTEMKDQLARQNARIQQLEERMARQQLLLEKLQEKLAGPAPAAVASVKPPEPAAQSRPAPAPSAVAEGSPSIAGIRLSGDFRLRYDMIARSGNSLAPPIQNARGRYRFRLNLDRDLDPRFRFHAQLISGPLNNWLTDNQDFSGVGAKHPISISEAYVDFHPNARFSLRGGRTEEVFADNSRFLWDDDVRFNGFHEIWNLPLPKNSLKLTSVEFRAAQYILTHPNVAMLSAGSPFTAIGNQPGQKVRDSNLFHQGIVLKGNLGAALGQQVTADLQVYRNPNEIQLASLASGFPLLISNALGIALSGPPPGIGNATTMPGGAVYAAPNFQIARIAYRVEAKSFRIGERQMPLWLDIQVSRNTGTSKLRDAVMASINAGAVRQRGDMRFLYQYAIKDANALISQFTDDDLGPASGVNIAAHGIRFDLGLARFLQWQTLLFLQDQRRPSNPAGQFFVPLPRGANTTYRFISQLQFVF
jgi:hypothetical protein